MDEIDKKILRVLQNKANIPLTDLSKKIGISSTPCWNRIKKMEENKTIIGKITILNKEKINLPITVFLSVSIGNHQKAWLMKFIDVIMKNDQIIEVYRLAGSMDYLLKIVAPSIKEYDEFQQKLINEFEFTHMTSNITLKELKKSYQFPLDFI